MLRARAKTKMNEWTVSTKKKIEKAAKIKRHKEKTSWCFKFINKNEMIFDAPYVESECEQQQMLFYSFLYVR